ncbi:hypothetical protein SMC3_02740 [Candidatus Cryosericum hinesii]|jgi:hypothetical protein|uniref:Uncharacterized protein n=2 Tax=Candidatus Cryosericum hinesii TaxID=2290915 RepID=A0A398DJI2_9BACT|nr:hypothetical protein SMC2_04170 [Candidatus Cryosericum hinesii]RIE13969.1 hypothetical protein SMC3_02740 [Candidatus Cryosericum hinesii]
MTHDMRTANQTMSDNEQPLELSAELRSEVVALFAPMDRSLASSVTAVIDVRRSRRRLLQGLWLGLSPIMAIAIVAVLYVGGAVMQLTLLPATSSSALLAPKPLFGIANVAPKGLVGSEDVPTLATACQVPSFRVMLKGDVARRQLLATWLRARHTDVALELDTAVPGHEVALMLQPDEVRGFVALMALHGFTGQEPSGLSTVAGCSLASWASSLGTSSLSICLIP